MNNKINIVRWLIFTTSVILLIFYEASCKKESQTPDLSITSFIPTSGTVGSTVTISGSSFSTTPGNNLVKFNGATALVVNATSSSLTTIIPAAATTGKLTVAVNGKTATSANDFTVITVSITDFSPTSGIVGTSVNITGIAFDPSPSGNIVNFNGTPATVTSATTTSLTVTVPSQATTGKITVEVNGNVATSSTDFTVLNPTITDFTPASGVAGTTVTISGANFSVNPTNNLVKFHGAIATVTSASSTQLVVAVPENATTGSILVFVSSGSVTSSNSFTILSPTIADFSPNIGSAGASVVITGTNFSTTSTFDVVKFNNTVATVTNATSTTITATVPSGVTAGKISIKVGPNTATSLTDFQVCTGSAELVISNLVISNISANRISFSYEYDLSNVGDSPADLTQMSDQGYVSTDNADNGGDLAASGWTLGNSTLNAGQTIHLQFSSNIVGGGTVDTYPYLVIKIFGSVTECSTANNTAIRSILN